MMIGRAERCDGVDRAEYVKASERDRAEFAIATMAHAPFYT